MNLNRNFENLIIKKLWLLKVIYFLGAENHGDLEGRMIIRWLSRLSFYFMIYLGNSFSIFISRARQHRIFITEFTCLWHKRWLSFICTCKMSESRLANSVSHLVVLSTNHFCLQCPPYCNKSLNPNSYNIWKNLIIIYERYGTHFCQLL